MSTDTAQTVATTAEQTLTSLAPVLMESAAAAKLVAPLNPNVALAMQLLPVAIKLLNAGHLTPQDVAQLEYTTAQEAKSSAAALDATLASSPTAA